MNISQENLLKKNTFPTKFLLTITISLFSLYIHSLTDENIPWIIQETVLLAYIVTSSWIRSNAKHIQTCHHCIYYARMTFIYLRYLSKDSNTIFLHFPHDLRPIFLLKNWQNLKNLCNCSKIIVFYILLLWHYVDSIVYIFNLFILSHCFIIFSCLLLKRRFYRFVILKSVIKW